MNANNVEEFESAMRLMNPLLDFTRWPTGQYKTAGINTALIGWNLHAARTQPVERAMLSHNQKATIREAISVIEGGEDYKGAYLYEKHGDQNVADDLRTFLNAQVDHIGDVNKMAPDCAASKIMEQK